MINFWLKLYPYKWFSPLFFPVPVLISPCSNKGCFIKKACLPKCRLSSFPLFLSLPIMHFPCCLSCLEWTSDTNIIVVTSFSLRHVFLRFLALSKWLPHSSLNTNSINVSFSLFVFVPVQLERRCCLWCPPMTPRSVADTASERETPLHNRSWASAVSRFSPSLSHTGDSTSNRLPLSTTTCSVPPQ